MKSMKKRLTIFLCMALVLSTFIACKKSDNQEEKGGNTGTASPTQAEASTEGEKKLVEIDYSEPVEYTYWLYSSPNDYYSSYNDNPVVRYLNKKFNMTLSFQQPASGTESDSLNLMFGTGEYTDLIDTSTYSGSISQLYEDGVIIDIADYLDYMPNLKKLLEDENIRKNAYTDDGKLLSLPDIQTENEMMWGGLVYRLDILETMTGGNVQFPSGNEDPTTIEDWDYMLPLFKQYFEQAGMADYAALIIPAGGSFPSDDLTGSFGTSYYYYNDNGTIKYGPLQDGYYNYLKKLNEWYEAGYIYKDFASRTNDLFYLPNTSLTYGGAAGIWFGLGGQLGDVLSMPEYGMNVDIRAVKNPLDTASGITSASNSLYAPLYESKTSTVIATTCKNVERLLATIDFMYSEEGSMLKACGLDKEHGSAENEIYIKNGLADGYYSFMEDGTFKFNEKLGIVGGTITANEAFAGTRIPGLMNREYDNMYAGDNAKKGSETWLTYQDKSTRMPGTLSLTVEEENTFTINQTNIDDYMQAITVKFILGTEELNETSWANFKTQLIAYGAEDNIAIQQAAYDRFLAR